MRTVTSTLGSLRRLALLGATLALAACGSSQNWHDSNPYASVGGTVEGFTGGTLALWNNGGDKLAIGPNGPFTFPLQIANGSDYSVVVATQPAGQTCTVTNGSGTANGNVKNVAVTCKPYTFTLRPLPAIYGTGKAVNYSPYRTAQGPRANEMPSDTDVLQDLTLLHTAGFNLLRLFGSEPPANDAVSEKTLRVAAQYYPDMKFQIGVALGGLTSCSDPKNDSNIAYLITKLAKYPNVVTISVGNETSFYSKYMPLACLESYIRTIRSQVTQPVTADDDFSFYAGKTTGCVLPDVCDRVTVKPDTILALIDFASIHLYPISNPGWWNWQQTGVAAGPGRAKAMMETSLVTAKGWFNEVANYKYVGAGGVTVSVGDSLPIVIGETGWKARQTNPASEIEQYSALPENAKWYYDLLYGNPGKYPAWQGSAGGPSTIFYFEAFDEAWKNTDDGWGLWDITRTARYALCGTPAGPACKADVYQGAGYYSPPPFATITFDSPTINYTFLGFAGAEDSQKVTDPVGGANKVARVNRSAGSLSYAGTIVGTGGNYTAGIIPISATDTRMTVRVYSPAAGIPVRLKLVQSKDPPGSTNTVETEVLTTKANAWETLTFDFANPVPGTPALNPALTFDQVVIFFNFGKTGAQAGAQTYYFDDVTFIGGGGISGGSAPTDAPTTVIPAGSVTIYSDAFSVAGFDSCPNWGQATICGGEQTIAGNKSLKYTNLNYQGLDWSGSPQNVSAKGKLHIDFWSPDLTSVKVSIISAGKENAFTQTLTTGSWNGVDIDLSNYTVPDLTAIIQIKLESTTPGTLYVDNIYFWGTAGGGGGGGASCGTTDPTCAPTTVIPAGSVTIYSDAFSVAGFDSCPNWGQATVCAGEQTIAGNKSLKYTNLNYQGLDWSGSPQNVSAKGKLHIDFWSPDLTSVKVSIISAGKENAFTQTLTTGSWNGVDIDLSNYTVPDLTAIIQIKLESTTPGTLYVDNIYFWGTAGSGGGGPPADMGSAGPVTIPIASAGDKFGFMLAGDAIFANDYIGPVDSLGNHALWTGATTTGAASNGNIGYYNDTLMSTSAQKIEEGGWVSGSIDQQGVPNFFRYFVLTAPGSTFSSSYMGLYVNSPSNGTVDIHAYASIKFLLWGPAAMYEQANLNPVLEVVLSGPKVAGCVATGSGGTELTQTFTANKKIGAGSAYKLALSGFTIKGLCGGDTNATAVAAVLSALARVSVTVPASSFNFTNANAGSSPTSYSTGVNLGPVGFTNN